MKSKEIKQITIKKILSIETFQVIYKEGIFGLAYYPFARSNEIINK